jgi:carbamoyl-phosphate synthase large subunit
LEKLTVKHPTRERSESRKTFNVLLTCAGRRDYLIHFFQRALDGRGEVIACDSNVSAPALAAADRSAVVPGVGDPGYFEALLSLCRKHRVRLLVSVFDMELPGLAERTACFRQIGTIPVVASPSVIATCHDKWAACQFMKASKIATPETCVSVEAARQALAQGQLRFPLVMKPRWGASSIGIEQIENERELELAHEWGRIQLKRSMFAPMCAADPVNCFIFQERLRGQEYGIDVVNDLEGRYACTLARRKLVMRYGNTDRAVTVADPRLEGVGELIGQKLGHIGSLDCDILDTDKGLQVLDLNPRFGGGYPFSHLAGANIPAALIAWATGDEPDPSWFRPRPDVLGSKYDGITVLPEFIAKPRSRRVTEE